MKKSNLQVLNIIILVLFGLQLWSGCGALYKPARDFLASNQFESANFGLYSYILFSQKPEKEDSLKYAELIKGYLNKVPELEQLSNYLPDSSINVVFFPVVKNPDYNFNSFSQEEQIDWMIANYDYARASAFLNKFEENYLNGPYIVSYRQPLSQVNSMITEKYLLQDFSQAHPKVVSLWVDEFLKQSSQNEYWNEEHLKTFSNSLRNAIAIAAEGLQEVRRSFSWWEESLKGWIVLK